MMFYFFIPRLIHCNSENIPANKFVSYIIGFHIHCLPSIYLRPYSPHHPHPPSTIHLLSSIIHVPPLIHHPPFSFIIHPHSLCSSIIHFGGHLYQSCALVRGSCLCRRRGARVVVGSDVRSLACRCRAAFGRCCGCCNLWRRAFAGRND